MDYLIKNLLSQGLLNNEASLTMTVLGALLFSLAIIYIVAPRIEKLETDRKLYISTLPWLISAGGLSALYASGRTDIILNGVIFTALVGALATAIFIGQRIEEKTDLDKSHILTFTGTLAAVAIVSPMDFSNPEIFVETGRNIIFWLGPLTAIYLLKKNRLNFEMIAPIAAHFMDASSTVVSISNGGVEKQFIAGLFIEKLGSNGIFLLKTIAIIPVVYIIHRETEGKKKIFYLYLITALGITITARNTLLTASGL